MQFLNYLYMVAFLLLMHFYEHCLQHVCNFIIIQTHNRQIHKFEPHTQKFHTFSNLLLHEEIFILKLL